MAREGRRGVPFWGVFAALRGAGRVLARRPLPLGWRWLPFWCRPPLFLVGSWERGGVAVGGYIMYTMQWGDDGGGGVWGEVIGGYG